MALAFDVKEIRKQRNPSNPHTLARDGNIVKLASGNFIKRYTVKLLSKKRQEGLKPHDL